MLDGAPDQALIDLGDHVGFHTTQKPTRIDPPFWSKGMLRLFITHLSSHREYAAELKNDLQNYGISCFVAHNDIEPTLEWQAEIESALATCDALIALLHPDFHKSSWTDQEIGFAMGRGVPVCSVRFGDDPYGFVSRFQAFNGKSKKAAVLAKELFDAYRKNNQTQAGWPTLSFRLSLTAGSSRKPRSSWVISKNYRCGTLHMPRDSIQLSRTTTKLLSRSGFQIALKGSLRNGLRKASRDDQMVRAVERSRPTSLPPALLPRRSHAYADVNRQLASLQHFPRSFEFAFQSSAIF